MINHDPNNPRTKNYSIIKSLLRNIEFITKNIFYFLVVFINCIIFRSKNNYLNIGNYKDVRYINYLFFSLKKKYNFSYNVNFQILNLIFTFSMVGPQADDIVMSILFVQY